MKTSSVIAALALTAACSYYQDPGQMEANVVRPGNFMTGPGTIVAISVLRKANPGSSSDPNLYRISVQMDSSGFQTVDTDSHAFFVGETVNITNDGRIEHVSGTTLNR
jgi:hypothetical protein